MILSLLTPKLGIPVSQAYCEDWKNNTQEKYYSFSCMNDKCKWYVNLISPIFLMNKKEILTLTAMYLQNHASILSEEKLKQPGYWK